MSKHMVEPVERLARAKSSFDNFWKVVKHTFASKFHNVNHYFTSYF
jgi:hypothetical protein